MLEEFRPTSLTDLAKQVGSDPFELVRVLVVANTVPDDLSFTEEQVQKVRQALGKR